MAMKTLATYLASKGAKKPAELCLELGISKGRLSQLRNETAWPPELALKLEEATGGAINASDLSEVVAKARAA